MTKAQPPDGAGQRTRTGRLNWIDLGLKAVIATAGIYGSVYLATNKQFFEQQTTVQKQRSDDITLIVNMATVPDEGHRAMAVATATVFVEDGRVPKKFLDAVSAYVAANSNLSQQTQINSIAQQIAQASPPAAPAPSTASDTLPIRVYFQYQQANDKDRIASLAKNLNGRMVAGKSVTVPPIENVSSEIRSPVLKCFRVDECNKYGDGLVKALLEIGAPPTLMLQRIKGYENSSTIRPNHFEAWFGPLPLS